ncbi:hypothetical protein [Persicitalea jodogahamensis]|uniref:Uncharacterized protein n=1 Tax=Persicitalea jodogahamensis TaxID=402147 RepID=A0A8J3D251_9BACT|nr:hypothetical protein [Persicitalea jodogahamensis]GHB59740.1 hypothetical protein GCM10007390_11800 [Persicitalea jodogahamensis]
MKLNVTQSTATKILIALLIPVIVFQSGIIAKVIPYEIVGGGRLENDAQMYLLSGISIALNSLLILVLLAKENLIRNSLPEKPLRITLWAFLFFFLLNTLGNLLAKTTFEKFLAFYTLLLAVLLYLILRKE